MAQAARLNLRMQKELKLLLTDPPPGATFPSLSAAAEAAAPSLSSIEAQIEGPEGTVYAGGFFKLKIQIPDRYPFQPPNVTFATPIYHPNIDTGGRICLDILNLPPKGAWQPSLNISTVLTSIGLLLSEPNPDDGLMQEASQEFKYNRQVFDQKARSMTEKFARVGACEIAAVAGKDCQAPSLDCTEAKRSDTSVEEVHQDLGGNKRLCGISRKLSLESSEREKIVGKSVNEGPSEHFERGLGSKRLKQEPCKVITGQIQSHQVPQKMSKKLSLESSTSIHVIKDNDTTDLVSAKGKSTLRTGCSELLPSVKVGSDFEQNYNQCDERSKPKTASIKSEKEKLLQPVDSKIGNTDEREKLLSVSKKSSPQHHSSGTSRNLLPSDTESHNKSEPHSAAVIGDGNGNGLPKIKHKKLGLAGRHLSYGSFISRQCQEKAKTENQPPISTVPHVNSTKNLIPASEKTVGHSSTSTCSDPRQPLKPLNQSSNRSAVNSQPEMESKVSAAQIDEKLEAKKQKTMAPPADMDKLIVLDSEDSDEDQRAAARSKLSLARRRLKGKSKSRTITLKEG